MNKHTLAKLALENSQVLALLAQFTPEVVSTIFVDLDTRESDIDIVCCSQDLQTFAAHFTSCFSQKDGFRLKQTGDYCVGRFVQNSFDIEVYTSSVPVVIQAAYCHYQVMLRLCRLGGECV
ncbi:hypothetical protein TDB9533_02628 [Thalassocella blandensis]|nr:hypothetical protein TDB9533_02628 [Thalassocella blandensis]